MKFSLKVLFFLSALIVISCSRKEDPIGPTEVPLSLILESDAGPNEFETIGLNSTIVFTVSGSDGTDYTDLSTIEINGEPISGSTYLFEEIGEFSVRAEYEGMVSNTLTFEVLEPTQRVLTIDVPKAFRNQSVTFGLMDDQGNNTAADATFYVNGSAIEGFTFSSSNTGEYEVYATYVINDETYTSDTKTFEVFIPKRKVVIEDYTGTWCGYCPRVAVAIDDIRAITSDISVVSIHKQSSSMTDPLHFDRTEELQARFNIPNSFPKAQLNRTEAWGSSFDINQVLPMVGVDTDIAIGIKSELNGTNLSVHVDVVFENGSTAGDKLVVYLLENKVISPQTNYFDQTPGHPYEGMGNPIENYEHNDGMRNALSGLFGDVIPETPAYQTYSKQYTFEVPSHYVGENLSFVVMVVDADDNAKNSQYAWINETKLFE